MVVPFAALTVLLAAAPAEEKHKAKVLLIGLDGVSRNMLEPYAERGVTPNLRALMKEGTRGHLASIWPLRTPQVWTSVVTGKLPGQHGVWDHVSNSWASPPPLRTKERLLVTAKDRKSKALWNILDERGTRTLTVGWEMSWPADPLEHGVMAASVRLEDDPRQATIKGSFWRDQPHQLQPEKLWPRARKLIVEPQELAAEEISAFASVPPPGSPLYGLPHLERYVYALKWSLARSKSVEALVRGLYAEARPEVLLAYFECSDSLLHRFFLFQQPLEDVRRRLEGHGLPVDGAEELKRRFGGAVEACYRDLDARVGRLLELARGPDTLVLVVSDHGFGLAAEPHQLRSEPFSGDHLDEGILIAAGGGAPAGEVYDGATVLDITPTVLAYLGVPVAKDMRGKALRRFLPGRGEPKSVETYEEQPQHDFPFPGGWPERTVPPRPTAAQMP